MDHPHDGDAPEARKQKPPIFLRMADEGNIPGRPSPKALAFLVAVAALGLVA
jgi:hypothetical protein